MHKLFDFLPVCFFLAALAFLNCGSKNSVLSPTPPTGTIGADGGTITTSDGVSLYFPSGAVSGNTEVWVKTISPSPWFASDTAVKRVVVFCSSSVTGFAQNVEIRIPFPAGLSEADSSKMLAGCIDDTSGLVTVYPAETRVIKGKACGVLSVPHFSNWLLELFTGPPPPASAGPISIPYYNQNYTNHCWATCTQMLTQAAAWNGDAQVNDIVGRMKIDDSGLFAGTFRFSPLLGKIIQDRTGLLPERKAWLMGNMPQLNRYLKQEIGLRNHPVALFNGQTNHMIVLIGYDNGGNFIVDNPNSTTNSAIGYTPTSWATISGEIGFGYSLVSMIIPTQSLDAGRSEITIEIASKAFRFIKPQLYPGDPSTFYAEMWSHLYSQGYGMFSGEVLKTDTLPAGIARLEQAGDVEIYNSSQTAAKSVTVWLDINALPSGIRSGYSTSLSLTLPPNSRTVAKFDPVDGSTFIDTLDADGSKAREYILSTRVFENSVELGRSTFRFFIAAKWPFIRSMSPSSALPGAVDTIKGLFFGVNQAAWKVVFGYGGGHDANAAILSWGDTQAVVKLPAGAVSGDVVIKAVTGDPISNKFPFTVSANTQLCTLSVQMSGADSTKFFGFGNSLTIYTGSVTAKMIYTVTDSPAAYMNYITDPVLEVFLRDNHAAKITGVHHTTLSTGNHVEFKSGDSTITVDFDPVAYEVNNADNLNFSTTPGADSCSFSFDFRGASDWPSSTAIFAGVQFRPKRHFTIKHYNLSGLDTAARLDTGSLQFGSIQLGCWKDY